MSLESALLDAVVSGPAPAGQRWLAWLVLGGEAPHKGGILAALRRSPLVGVDLDLERPHEAGRKVDL